MSHSNNLLTSTVIRQWKQMRSVLGDGDSRVDLDGLNLDIAQIICVSRYNCPINIGTDKLELLENNRDKFLHKLGQGHIIYGVNTGLGSSAYLRPLDLNSLQRRLVRELSYGVLPPGARDHCRDPLPNDLRAYRYDLGRETTSEYIPSTWTRAAIVVRINSLVKGYSAVRPLIVQRLQDVLHHDIVPMIPLRGSISASGDLNPLAYISGAIQGKPTIRVLSKTGSDVYADEALKQAKLTPVSLEPKEGLALVNGTAVSAAAAAIAIFDASNLAIVAQILSAMSVEALNGTTESFHPIFAETRPHPGQFESAWNIRAFLKGSKLVCTNDGTDGSLRQDRYSIRTASQWIGPCLEDLRLGYEQISVECNSVTDNPLMDSDGNVFHGGNFQAKSITSAMDKTRQAIQTIGRMLFVQCTEIINPAMNNGLPPNLVGEDPTASAMFQALDIHIAALQSELGFLSGPVNHVQTAEMGNQALNSLAFISARYTHVSVNILAEMAAVHLLALCQAVDLRALTSQFLDSYRPRFASLVAETFKFPDSGSVKEVESFLWPELIKSFKNTAFMGDNQRFKSIAGDLRSSFIVHPSCRVLSDPLQIIDRFSEAAEASLRQEWCLHREFFIMHGDATEFLGMASNHIYSFVRHTLKIPFLSTSQILTPQPLGDDSSHKDLNCDSKRHVQAPTVGTYTSAIYRALQDGTVLPVLTRILEASTPPTDDTGNITSNKASLIRTPDEWK